MPKEYPGTERANDLDQEYYLSEERKKDKATAGLSEDDIPYLRGYTREHIKSKVLEEQLKPPTKAQIENVKSMRALQAKREKGAPTKPKFAGGGAVRGAGCATKGVKKCKMY